MRCVVVCAFRALASLNKVVNDEVFIDGVFNYVLAFYILDFCLVLIGVILYFRNRAIDRAGRADAE